MELIGQIVGIIALIVACSSYQMKTSKQLLLTQTCSSALFCLHYLLICAPSGMALNIVGIVRNLTYYNKDKKFLSHKSIPYIFALIIAVVGALSWQGWYSIFIIAGLAINSVYLSFPDPQRIRRSILVSSPMVLVYTIFTLSLGGALNEIFSIVSAAIGIVRYRKNNNSK